MKDEVIICGILGHDFTEKALKLVSPYTDICKYCGTKRVWEADLRYSTRGLGPSKWTFHYEYDE